MTLMFEVSFREFQGSCLKEMLTSQWHVFLAHGLKEALSHRPWPFLQTSVTLGTSRPAILLHMWSFHDYTWGINHELCVSLPGTCWVSMKRVASILPRSFDADRMTSDRMTSPITSIYLSQKPQMPPSKVDGQWQQGMSMARKSIE